MDKFGLDLLRLSVGGDTESGVLGSRSNAVIVLIHWRLLKEGFRCAGTGDAFSADKDISPPTEALPPGWNCMDDGLHCLRYRHKTTNEKFVLKSFVTATESDQASSSTSPGGQHQIVVLLRVGDDRTSELDIDLNEEVSESEERFKPIHEDQMLAMIEDKLLKPLMKVKKSEEGDEKKRKSDESDQRDRDPLRGPGRPSRPGPPPRGPPRLPDMPGPGNPDPDDPFGPFGPGGGNPNGPFWDPVPGLPNMGPRGGFPGRPRGGFPGGPRGGFPGGPGFGPGGLGGGGLGGGFI